MNGQLRKILEGKASQRKRLAALPFAEKMKLLEQLRDRALAIANSPLARRQAQKQHRHYFLRRKSEKVDKNV